MGKERKKKSTFFSGKKSTSLVKDTIASGYLILKPKLHKGGDIV
jgi:hypothetical protein